MAMYTFICVMGAMLVIFGGATLVLYPLFNKWCEAKGITLDDGGVDYGKE